MLIARVFRPAGAEDSGDRNPALTRWATFCRAYGAEPVSTICDSFTASAGACAAAQVLCLRTQDAESLGRQQLCGDGLDAEKVDCILIVRSISDRKVSADRNDEVSSARRKHDRAVDNLRAVHRLDHKVQLFRSRIISAF